MAQYNSKHGLVNRPQAEMYMAFTDLRNFINFLPEDKKKDITADFDSLTVTVRGLTLGVKAARREPYSFIELKDNGAPFEFTLALHFDNAYEETGKTDFYINADINLDLMMKMMIGNKLQEALDKIVDTLVDVSNGRMPDGMSEEIKAKMNGESTC